VIDSQGSGMVKDLSAIERGGPALKLFTTFYSFFNTALNLGVDRTMSPDHMARKFANYLLLFVVPAVLGQVLKDALTPGGGDDDPKKLARKLIGAQLSYLFGLMFGVREIGSPIANIAAGEPFGKDYTGPAGTRMLADVVKLTQQASQGQADDGLRKAIVNVVGRTDAAAGGADQPHGDRREGAERRQDAQPGGPGLRLPGAALAVHIGAGAAPTLPRHSRAPHDRFVDRAHRRPVRRQRLADGLPVHLPRLRRTPTSSRRRPTPTTS
jgi:hypothetical protein